MKVEEAVPVWELKLPWTCISSFPFSTHLLPVQQKVLICAEWTLHDTGEKSTHWGYSEVICRGPALRWTWRGPVVRIQASTFTRQQSKDSGSGLCGQESCATPDLETLPVSQGPFHPAASHFLPHHCQVLPWARLLTSLNFSVSNYKVGKR